MPPVAAGPAPADLPGGAGLLAAQAACPFMAVARYRLAARPLEEARSAADPALLGTLVHELLQRLWNRLGDSQNLAAHDDDALRALIDLPAFDIAPTVNPIWLLGYLTRPTYYARQLGLARGQRKARRVHPSDLLASSLLVPPRDLQNRIAEILTTSQCDIDKSKRLLQSIEAQKRGLMQKLLTGEWRLHVPKETTA